MIKHEYSGMVVEKITLCGKEFVRCTLDVRVVSPFNDGEMGKWESMVMEFNTKTGTLDFRNDDDFYGQGINIPFDAIYKFLLELRKMGYGPQQGVM